MPKSSDTLSEAGQAAAWKQRAEALKARTLAAQRRDIAATRRAEAGLVREEAGRIRADAARVRDDAARTRDDAARVRDRAARVRDEGAVSRDKATRSREEALRIRLARDASREGFPWEELLELDRIASSQSHDAATQDREAAALDRDAAEKDRVAAERDRTAANSDRMAADKDREAADRERQAADADREAADMDRAESERDLGLAETRLSRTERLAVLGQLAAGVSHEVNTPLMSILASLAAMSQAVDDDAPGAASLVPMIANARHSAERIAGVVADMRAWIHDDTGLPARQEVNVARLVENAVRVARFELDKVAEVILDVQPTPALWGVAARLERMLVNLLINAAKAVSGPRDDNEIRISARGSGSSIVLEVRDTGTGISPEELPHVFDPFFTTRGARGGTGLGLSLCHRIVTEHAGTITVVSPPGEGATFRVELPGGSSTGIGTSRVPASAQTGTRRARVLLVDDDEHFRRSMVMLLSKNCDVTVARDGQEGLARLLDPGARYDVVLCDLTMPVMNGVEFHQRLSVERPDLAADVVFTTGGATTPEASEFLERTPNVQLQKPFLPQQLRALVAERLARALAEDEAVVPDKKT